MSNDLISRSAVVKIIEDEIKLKSSYVEHNAQIDIMFKVKEMPTAYDVDKVVEQLEKESQNIELIYPTDQGYDYEDAIGIDINKTKQIVKSGGIE